MIAALQNKRNRSIGLELLKKFIESKQLTRSTFFQLNELLAITAYEYRQGRVSKEEIIELNSSFGNDFLENTSFENIIQLYYFDSELRKIIFEAIESIEIYFRTQITYSHALRYESFGYLEKD